MINLKEIINNPGIHQQENEQINYSIATQCNTIQQQKLDEQGYSRVECWVKKAHCRKAHAL